MAADPWSIRPATNADAALLKAWLPQATLGLPRPSFFIVDSPDRPLAAGSLRLLSRHDRHEARFLLFVDPAARRQGIGRALLHTLLGAAQTTPAHRLLCGAPVPPGSPEAQFFAAAGFSPLEELHTYDASVDAMHQLCQNILTRRPLPASLHVGSLASAPRDALVALILSMIGGFEDVVTADLTASDAQPHSRVVTHNEKPVGTLICRLGPSFAIIPSIAVVPQHRNTSASVALRASTLASLLQAGISRFRFTANTLLHRDSVKTAQRLEAETVECVLLFGCPLST